MSQLAACLAGSVHTDASAVLCPPPEQTRSAMHKPIGLSERSSPGKNSALGVELAPVSAPPLVFYIDKQRLGRDCISEQLATHLSKWTIEPLASIRELPRDEDWSRLSLVILNTHGASLSTAEVADEMKAIAETAPSVPLIVISDLDDATEVHMGIQRGARGYLPAGLPFPQALAAIRFVCDGGTYIPACVLAATSGTQQTSPARPMDANGRPIQFSPRQLQVLERLKQGKQNKIIAYELGMCESTVKVHIRHIMKKLNARNRTQVVLLTQDTSNRAAAAFAA
jgi:DNA-binding NarL/FixJ family response regulator